MKRMSKEEMNSVKGGLALFAVSNGPNSVFGSRLCLNFSLPTVPAEDTRSTIKF